MRISKSAIYSPNPSFPFVRWLHERLGAVYGKDGRGGSGVFVYLRDGKLVLLTARHVVLRSILTGEITVARFSETPSQSYEPQLIRIHSEVDAAYLQVDREKFAGEALAFEDWTVPEAEVTDGMLVASCGIIGESKTMSAPDRKISSLSMCYATNVLTCNDSSGRIVCKIDESLEDMPKSFKGISGGPLFSSKGILIGINVAEARKINGTDEGRIYATPIAKMEELHTPFKSKTSPSGFYGQDVTWDFPIANLEDTNQWMMMRATAQYFWPVAEHVPQERIGKALTLQFLAPGIDRFVINTESVSNWPDPNDDESRKRSLRETLAFLLLRSGYGMLG